jgi:Flp pilus assembly secretin CpaC
MISGLGLGVSLRNFGIGLHGAGKMQAELDALASEGLVTTLSGPNLTATSAHTASSSLAVNSRGRSPLGTRTVTVGFKIFCVEHAFALAIVDTTHFEPQGAARRLPADQYQRRFVPITSTATVQIPALIVRCAETTVGLASGQRFASSWGTPPPSRTSRGFRGSATDPRSAVPLAALPTQRDRVSHHRDAVFREVFADPPRGAARRLRRAT